MIETNRDVIHTADDICDRLRSSLEPAHNGEIVAIDVDPGDHFLGKDELDAYDKGIRKHPGRTFVFKRVGYPATHIA